VALLQAGLAMLILCEMPLMTDDTIARVSGE